MLTVLGGVQDLSPNRILWQRWHVAHFRIIWVNSPNPLHVLSLSHPYRLRDPLVLACITTMVSNQIMLRIPAAHWPSKSTNILYSFTVVNFPEVLLQTSESGEIFHLVACFHFTPPLAWSVLPWSMEFLSSIPFYIPTTKPGMRPTLPLLLLSRGTCLS